MATGTSCIWEVERSPGKCARAVLSQCRQERTEDKCEEEVAQPTDQSQRPVHMRKSSNHYGEWTLNGLQQMSLFFKDAGGQGKKVQGANKDTETKISSEEGKHTAGKLIILSVR